MIEFEGTHLNIEILSGFLMQGIFDTKQSFSS